MKLPTDGTLTGRDKIVIKTRDNIILFRKSMYQGDRTGYIGWPEIRSYISSNGSYISAMDTTIDLYSIINNAAYDRNLKSHNISMFLEVSE